MTPDVMATMAEQAGFTGIAAVLRVGDATSTAVFAAIMDAVGAGGSTPTDSVVWRVPSSAVFHHRALASHAETIRASGLKASPEGTLGAGVYLMPPNVDPETFFLHWQRGKETVVIDAIVQPNATLLRVDENAPNLVLEALRKLHGREKGVEVYDSKPLMQWMTGVSGVHTSLLGLIEHLQENGIDGMVTEREAVVFDPRKVKVVARPQVQVVQSMSVDGALAWLRETARQLVGSTVIVDGVMVDDSMGASYSTLGPLRNYLTTDDNVDASVHLAALEAVRRHSHTQVDRAAFERAANALQAHFAGSEPATRIYAGKQSVKSGLADGAHFRFTGSAVELSLPYRRQGPTANQLLERGGCAKGSDYRWSKQADGRFVLVVPPDRALRVAAALAPEYPDVAGVLRQNAQSWQVQAGASGPPSSGPSSPGPSSPVPEPTHQLDPMQGTVHGWDYTWVPDKFRVDLYPPKSAELRVVDYARSRFPDAGTASIKTADYRYGWAIPTTKIGLVLVGLLRDFPDVARALTPLAAAWTAQKAEVKQSKEHGIVEGGEWRYVPGHTEGKGTIYLATTWAGRWWDLVPGARMHRSGAGGLSGYVVAVPERRVLKAADALRRSPTHVRLAEALTRVFGGIARVFEEEDEVCAPLLDMAGKVDPATVTHPTAMAAIEHVRRAFEIRAPVDFRPLPFQEIGIAFAKLTGYRALIGDSMGLGKTAQALGAILADPEELLPAVIIVPKNVLGSWVKHVRKWLPSLPVQSVSTMATQLPPKGWKGAVLTSWDIMRERLGELIEWEPSLAVWDEAHYGKNPGAMRTKAMMELAKAVPHVMLLTGTPVTNDNIVELWPLLHAVSPENWGTQKAFINKFVAEVERIPTEQGGVIEKFVGVKAEEELKKRLACTMIRRLKSAALPFLPPKTRTVVEVGMSQAAWADYREAQRRFEEWLYNAVSSALRAEGVDPETATEAAVARVQKALKAKILTQIGALRVLTGRAKVEHAIRLAEPVIATGQPIIIWCYFKEVVDTLVKAFGSRYRLAVITGDVGSAADRSDIEDRFQAGQIDVLIATTAAKEGLTLTRANTALFVERFWTPAAETQAEDRIHRIGQTREAFIYTLHIPETIDDFMSELVERKRAFVDQVIGSEEEDKADPDVIDSEEEAVTALVKGALRQRKNPGKSHAQRAGSVSVASVLSMLRRPPKGSHTDKLRRGEIVQTVLIPRRWSKQQAKHWLTVNGYRVVAPDLGAAYARFRQVDPAAVDRTTFRTVRIGNGGPRLVVARPIGR